MEQFLERVDWRLPVTTRACSTRAPGTGIIGLWFLRRFPESEVVAFDIDRQMLARARAGARAASASVATV